jgi:predicted nucleic acid-binding protein
MIVVSDTTPVNYLILIDQIHLLKELYGCVFLPQAVYEETQREGTPEKVREWTSDRPEWAEVRAAAATDPALKLGAGEREAIALAEELRADLLLLDDGKARREARERGLTVTGTLAVLVTAAGRGLVDLPSAIAALRQTTFRAPAGLIASILEQHREQGPDGDAE